MENLSLDEIIYITRFLNVKNTFNFLKSLKWNLNHDLKKSITIKNKKIMVIENLYNSYFEGMELNELKELIEFFIKDIDLEDLICFMANVYPKSPKLKDTMLPYFLHLFGCKKSTPEWNLVKVHFKIND